MTGNTSAAPPDLTTPPTSTAPPGSTGRPAANACRRAASLSPAASSTSALGPMNTIPAASQARASRGFSARNPYPGWIASAPAAPAASITASTLR